MSRARGNERLCPLRPYALIARRDLRALARVSCAQSGRRCLGCDHGHSRRRRLAQLRLAARVSMDLGAAQVLGQVVAQSRVGARRAKLRQLIVIVSSGGCGRERRHPTRLHRLRPHCGAV